MKLTDVRYLVRDELWITADDLLYEVRYRISEWSVIKYQVLNQIKERLNEVE